LLKVVLKENFAQKKMFTMNDILAEIKKLKIVSIIGMGKNVGKTTTMNYLIKQFWGKATLGLTSIGLDGEKFDILSGYKKPRIYVRSGTLIATAKTSLLKGDFTREILRTLPRSTPMGKVIIARALSDGYVELAGPSISREISFVCNTLKELGAEIIFVDGALSRKSLAAPGVTKGVLLATGASISRDFNEVISATINTVELLQTKEEENSEIINIYKDFSKDYKLIFIYTDHMNLIKVDSVIGSSKEILNNLDETIRYVLINGVVTDNLILSIIKSPYAKFMKIVLEDGTKLFLSPGVLNKLHAVGCEISVVKSINLIGITINPYSPEGYEFDKTAYLEELKSKLNYPILNVMDVIK